MLILQGDPLTLLQAYPEVMHTKSLGSHNPAPGISNHGFPC